MGILSKWFGKNREKGELPEPCRVIGNDSVKMVDITAVVLIKGDSVSIKVKGLEHLNVCLASFLTKGVSYAQEKYNEYKQSPKSEAKFGMSESTKAMLKELAHKDSKKGGER